MNHTHKPMQGTQWGYGAGTVAPNCRTGMRGKPCTAQGAHISIQCRCGATGVICPQQKRITWHEEETP